MIKRFPIISLAISFAIIFFIDIKLYAQVENNWTPIGPSGGSINMIRVDPLNEDIIYGCTDTGVYKSIDGGLNWSILRGGLPFTDIHSIIIDPINANIIYVAISSRGIYKSVDGGMNWFEVNEGLPNTNVGTMAISFTYNTTPRIFVGISGNGLYMSIDNGLNWTNVGLTSSIITTIILDPLDENILYVGTYDDGIFKSIDAGSTWVSINNGIVQSFTGNYEIYSLSVNPDSTNIIYAGSSGFTPTNSIYKSVDGGENWNVLSSTYLLVNSLIVSPVNTDIIYAGTSLGGLLKSINGGLNWVSVDNIVAIPPQSEPNVTILTVAPTNPDLLFMGILHEGVFKSEDSGSSWSPARQGISNGNCDQFIIDKNRPNRIYASVGMGLWKSINEGISWKNLGMMSVNSIAIDPEDSNVIFVAVSSLAETDYIKKSTDGGNSWTVVLTVQGGHVNSVSIDPVDKNKMYAGYSGGIQRSFDGGLNWQEISLNEIVKCTAIDPDSTNIIYAGTYYNGLFKSKNYGLTWNHLALSGKSVSTIELNSTYSNILYAVTVEGEIFKSTDKGKNLIALNEGLGDATVSSVAIDESNPNKLFIGTIGEGVYYSENAGSTWNEINEGLVNSYVNEIKLHPEKRNVIYAATDGTGILKYIMTETLVDHSFATEFMTYNLSQNYPNPFNSSTKISFEIPQYSSVSLKIYDLLGREVVTLVDEDLPGGVYNTTFNAENFPSGLYVYRLRAGEYYEEKKLLILR